MRKFRRQVILEELNKQQKKELKQFSLKSKEECIIYLQNIIAIGVKTLDNHKRFLKELEEIIEQYQPDENIPYGIYSDIQNKISNVESYMLNLWGDGQTSSISYFKFRNLVGKLNKKSKLNVELYIMNEEEEKILRRFNLSRNWQNHIPESLLTSEIEMIKQRKAVGHTKNPIEVYFYDYVTYDYIVDLLKGVSNFHIKAQIMLQCAKKDYSLLIGESVRIKKTYVDKPKDLDGMCATELSAKVQGLDS